MAFPLNEQQIACLDRHLHIAVTANAGSGKTAVLVERYLRIAIEDKVPVESIVAITFTKRAAAEMRERIHNKIKELIAKPDPWVVAAANNDHAEAEERLRLLLRSLGKVRISTFHSFCAGLVRQYADVVGHPHTVRDLDAIEAQALQSAALSNILKQSLSPGNPLRNDILKLVEQVSLDTARHIMQSIMRDHARVERAAAVLGKTEEEHIAHVFDCVQEAQCDILVQVLRMLIESLAPFNIYNCYQKISSALFAVQVELRERGLTPETHELAKQTIDTYFTKQAVSVRKKVVDKGLWDSGDVPKPPAGIEALYAFFLKSWEEAPERTLEEILRTILKLGVGAYNEYRDMKAQRGAIDFSDMISDALRLLRDEEIASQVRLGIQHIMIDEFQDTDPTQYEVLELLAPDLAGGSTKGPFAFVVGDDKQSIYQFRNADVRLFRKVRAAISRVNLQHGTDAGLRKLTWSYRMHPDLCEAINSACSEIFSTSAEINERSYHVEYEPLVAANKVASEPTVQRFRVLETPEVESQDSDSTDDERDDHATVEEFDFVAAEIVRMLHRPERALQPKDIAVLVSKNRQKTQMAEALRALGVPCTVYGGRSFFSRPEIADVRNALIACIDRQNDLATAAAMRSPLLQCSDVEILLPAFARPHSSIQDGLSRLVADGTASEPQRRANLFFETFANHIRKQPTHAVVEEMLAFTSWHTTITREDRAEQMKNNVDKLISMCRDIEHQGGSTIADILAAIAVPSDDSEAEASVLSTDDAVHVMTIHLSKGLEFEAVVLAGLNSAPPNQLYRESTELGFTVNLPKYFRSNADAITAITQKRPLSHAANTRITDNRDLAEGNRLAYVALTRAKNELLISLPASRFNEKNTLNGIATVFHKGTVAYAGTHCFSAVSSHDVKFKQTETASVSALDVTRILLPLAPTAHTPSTMVSAWTQRSSSPETPSGSTIGTAVHHALAELLPLLSAYNEEQIMQRVVASLKRSGLSGSIISIVAKEVFLTLQSPLLQTHAHRIPHARIEQQLVAVVDDALIYGNIDVRFPAENGIVEIWDWKTSAVKTVSDIAKHSDHYAPQLKSYAELCFAADALCHTVVARLVFTKAFEKGLPPDHVMMFTRPM